MKPLAYTIRKRQIVGLTVFAVILLGLRAAFYFWGSQQQPDNIPVQFFSLENAGSAAPPLLSDFDPNTLDEKQWENLGFSDKQTATILKYKKILGGSFLSKEQFRKCYAVSPEKYEQLKDFILLPETTREAKSSSYSAKPYRKKELVIRGKFNPDQYTARDWMSTGFSENQANAILKYKHYLGGSFVSKEKFRECFIISAEHYQQLAPYLILPEKTPENFSRKYISASKNEKTNIQYRKFDPNNLDTEGWKALGFSEKQAAVILHYKDKKLKGNFRTPEDLKNCFVVSEKKFEELRPYINIQSPQQDINLNITTSEKPAVAKTEMIPVDYTKTDLNKITFAQLRAFGFDEKAAASYLGFRKKLGGFVSKKQILETYNLDKNLAEKLVQTCPLDASGVQKYRLAEAPEEWLKNHPYFKYSADKIIFYRVTYPDDEKIWKFLKKSLKPEYEARMRLYVK